MPSRLDGGSPSDDCSQLYCLMLGRQSDLRSSQDLNPLARSLVVLEALVGQLFPVILIARLVTMEIDFKGCPHLGSIGLVLDNDGLPARPHPHTRPYSVISISPKPYFTRSPSPTSPNRNGCQEYRIAISRVTHWGG